MKISLIIGTYNRGIAIAETLDSVFAQVRVPDEVIVVDDGSTDETASFIRANYRSVRLIEKSNGGTSSSRNAGAEQASHELLIFLDHDDILLSHAVQTLLDLMGIWKNAASGHCDHELHDLRNGIKIRNHHNDIQSFQRLRNLPPIEKRSYDRLYGRTLYSQLLSGNLLQQPWIVRKDAFHKTGGFDTSIKYCEDWDIYLRLSRFYPVAVSDEVISIHRLEGENLSLAAWESQCEMYEKTLHKQFTLSGRLSRKESWLIRKRIGGFYKSRGDHFVLRGIRRDAWLCYLRSALWNPFDHVVLARLGIWIPAVFSDIISRKGSIFK